MNFTNQPKFQHKNDYFIKSINKYSTERTRLKSKDRNIHSKKFHAEFGKAFEN